MRKYGILGAAAVAGCSGDDAAPVASTSPDTAVNFIAPDEPGPWFKCIGTVGCVNAGSESLAIVPPNTTIRITNGNASNTVHTFTSLLYPTGAANMPLDQPEGGFRGSRTVNLVDKGL